MHIELSIGEIADLIKGATTIDRSLIIKNITSLEQAKAGDLAFIFDKEEAGVFNDLSPKTIEQSKAAVLIASSPLIPSKPYIIVSDPLAAFGTLVNYLEKKDSVQILDDECVIHNRAVVDASIFVGVKTVVDAYTVVKEKSSIGKNCHIGSHVYIGKECVIGDNVKIYPQVTILDRTIIGSNTIIHSGAVIGSDGFGFRMSKNGLHKIPHIGLVRIGNHVEIGANTCIDRAVFHETVIEDYVKLDNQIHIAHNVHIGAHSAIIAQSGIAGGTRIGQGCQIGGQVGVKDHLVIGNGAKIVSQSGVMRNVEPGEIVAGSPAIPFGQWKRLSVILTKLPSLITTLKPQANNSFLKKWFSRFFKS